MCQQPSRRASRRTTRAAAAAAIVGALAGADVADAPPPPAVAAWADTRQIPFDLARWIVDPRRCVVRDAERFPGTAQLVHSGGAGTVAYVRDLRFGDGEIECWMAGGAYLGLSFRVRPIAGGDPTARLSEDIYVRIAGNQRAATIQYYPHGKMKQEELHRAPYERPLRAIAQDEWFRLRVRVRGRQAWAFLDDRPEPVLSIGTLLHEHLDGSVGVRSWGGRFAQFVVRTEEAAAPQQP